MSRADLADFLRRRREALRPDRMPPSAVNPPGRRARRTPGLRREEVAARAGVSVSGAGRACASTCTTRGWASWS
ncbi:helix-turn-helix domain-containing protein [Saccharopolyspora tripterygii]